MTRATIARMLRIPFVVVAACACVLSAQAPAPAPAPGGTESAPSLPDLGAPAALPEGAPPHLQLVERNGLRTHAYWLADDAREGRYTSSKGQQATAKYVAEHFQKLGLRPLGDKKGFLQSYPLIRTALDPSTSLQVGDLKVATRFAVLAPRRDAKIALGGKFVWCGNGTAGQITSDLAGKLPLVVLHKLPKAMGLAGSAMATNRFADVAQKLGSRGATAGVVCLLDDKTSYGDVLNNQGLLPDHPLLRYDASGGDPGNAIPLFVLSAEQSQLLFARIGIVVREEGGAAAPTNDKVTGKLVIGIKVDDKATSSNVVAVLEGRSRKSECVVFSAHHDHIGQRLDGDAFNGADDNASGSAGLLEIAEAFAKGGERPERSIVFLSVSGEELGLWGSKWFSEHPSWPLDKIVADINIDMIGRAAEKDGKTLMQVTPSFQHEKYSSIVQDGVALGARFGITFISGDQYYQRSDHYNFAVKGVPVVFFCDGEHPDYHQVSDSADKLDYVRMEAVARLAFWTGWQVAAAKGRPKELGVQSDW